jgi:suppressor for copper-sensitivity B
VIPVRIMSVVELARQSRRRFVTIGLAYALGILLLFVGLAAANVFVHEELREQMNWGRHFQSAPFRLGMAMVFVAMAANLFGVFAIFVPRRLVEMDGSIRTQGHMASLSMGLMTGILSTPCSFALLVVAFTWAQTQPLWLGSLAIIMMGVGMAAPHALLAVCPWMIGWVPRPGRWMELLRQAMGFALLGVAVWLVGTLSSDPRVAWTLGYAVVLVFCLWVWGTVVRYSWPMGAKLLVRWLALVAAVAAGAWMLTPPKAMAVHFQPFDEARIAKATGEGKIVLVDFTAGWCLSCKLVDYFIYDQPEVASELEDRGVVAMRADVTSADSPANALLYERLKGAPPLTVIYPPSGPPIRLEGKFSRFNLIRALKEATPRESRPAD